MRWLLCSAVIVRLWAAVYLLRLCRAQQGDQTVEQVPVHWLPVHQQRGRVIHLHDRNDIGGGRVAGKDAIVHERQRKRHPHRIRAGGPVRDVGLAHRAALVDYDDLQEYARFSKLAEAVHEAVGLCSRCATSTTVDATGFAASQNRESYACPQ